MRPSDLTRSPAQLLQPAIAAVTDQLVALTDAAAAAGAGVLGVLPHQLAEAINGTVTALAGISDLVPALGSEIDAVADQLHAQRLSIQAVAAQLTALDGQLAVLENALVPLQGWSHQLTDVGAAVSIRLHPSAGTVGGR